ncbi:MAG: glycoside hydrolase family 78 protein [Bacteroidales bacterium]|nr:glycoside hydrolase family 78 protein [Bacteroidales bacterium]
MQGKLFFATNLKCEHLVAPLGTDNPAPRFSWMLSDRRYGAYQAACRLVAGTDSVAVASGKGDMWDSGRILSDKILVSYAGKALQPFTRYFWAVKLWDMNGQESPFAVSSFETGMMSVTNWKGSWISDGIDVSRREAPLFRKDFSARKKIISARAYIAVAGLYELYINGKLVGDHRLDPMYTRFDRRNLYVTHDITTLLNEGLNTAGVLLGNGWYNHQSSAVWFFDKAPWRNRPVFCMDIRLTYEDGSVETISTDTSWKTSLSAVIFNSIYTAEHYDARLEQPGWKRPGFSDKAWKQATLRAAPSQNIVAQQLHPIRNVKKVTPVKMNRINDTTWVYDLGRNISGVSEFTVIAEAGTVFRLKHSERLSGDGRADQSNIIVHYRPVDDSDPFQTDIFVAGGKGPESFMPRFSYKGFQYVEVTANRPADLSIASLSGWFMHSDVPPAGRIETSNPTINKIWQAANNSYLSNLFGYPTDCPQREKNGWTGDAHIAIETGLYNFDGITVYEKWLADHRDEQQPNGILPAIIPTSGWGYHWANGPDWTSTIAIIPWNIYLFYGDSKLLADCYDNIKRYVNYIESISPSGLTSWGLGDWVPVKSKAPVELTSSAYYFVDATILANAARLFSKEDDYSHYSALAEKIKNAINAKYLDRATGLYGKGLQTELSVPLQWGIVPDDMKAKVAANLSRRVEADNNHIDVGLLGTKAILNALSENGYANIAYRVASQETFPSWGWWIVNGATTLYENWPIDAKSDISMNHIMFGEISAWFYKALGGIRPDPEKPGFKNILLKPLFVEGLNSASVTHVSPYGEIVSEWIRKKNTIVYGITVPANSGASLFVPDGFEIKTVRNPEDRKPVTLERNSGGFFVVPPGKYEIELTSR